MAAALMMLVISMLPSANVFRWSFRWLPFFHLILALCAAEALQNLSGTPDLKSLFARPGVLAFVLVVAIAIAMSESGQSRRRKKSKKTR